MQRNPERAGRGPRLAGLALLTLVAVGVMLRLSLWQWDRAQATHSLLNYSYAVEWVLFAVLTVAGLARLVVEERRRAVHEQPEADPMPPAEGVMIGPPLQPGEELPEITLVRLRRRLRI